MIRSCSMVCLMVLMLSVTIPERNRLRADCPHQGSSLLTSCTTNMPFPMKGGTYDQCFAETDSAKCAGNILGSTNFDYSVTATVHCQADGYGPPSRDMCYTYYTCTWDTMRARCIPVATTVLQGKPVYYRCSDSDCVAYWKEYDKTSQ